MQKGRERERERKEVGKLGQVNSSTYSFDEVREQEVQWLLSSPRDQLLDCGDGGRLEAVIQVNSPFCCCCVEPFEGAAFACVGLLDGGSIAIRSPDSVALNGERANEGTAATEKGSEK